MCYRSHLKTIKIYGFPRDEDRLHATKNLLQAASVLDAVIHIIVIVVPLILALLQDQKG